jgi:hypothetical protein
MSLRVLGLHNGEYVDGSSVAGTLQQPAHCVVDWSRSFFLDIHTGTIPTNGYEAWQTQVHYGTLTYDVREVSREVIAPKVAMPLRGPAEPTGTEGFVAHGAINGIPPQLNSVTKYCGPLVRLELRCEVGEAAPSRHEHPVILLAHGEADPTGSGYRLQEAGKTVSVSVIGEQEIPGLGHKEIAAVLVVKCDPTWQYA